MKLAGQPDGLTIEKMFIEASFKINYLIKIFPSYLKENATEPSSGAVLQKSECPFLCDGKNWLAPLSKMDISTFAIQRQSY